MPRAWASAEGMPSHQQIGDERGVKRAGTDGDEVGALDGFQRLRQRRGVGWIEHQLGDAPAAGGDVGFAAHERAVVHARHQRGIGRGDGVDAATGGENLRRQLDGVGKVAGNLGERGDKEVAEVVSLERVAAAEAMGEEPGQQIFFLAERDHAVAQVAGRQHVEVLAQAAGGAAVVGDGDHGGEVGDEAGLARARLAGGADVAAQSAQQRGETGAAADGDHAQRPPEARRFRRSRAERGRRATRFRSRR